MTAHGFGVWEGMKVLWSYMVMAAASNINILNSVVMAEFYELQYINKLLQVNTHTESAFCIPK